MTPRIDHISAMSLFVEDPQAAKTFYRELFDAKVIYEDENSVATQSVALKARGVSLLAGPKDRPWGMRTANFVDPAGHSWEVDQKIDSK